MGSVARVVRLTHDRLGPTRVVLATDVSDQHVDARRLRVAEGRTVRNVVAGKIELLSLHLRESNNVHRRKTSNVLFSKIFSSFFKTTMDLTLGILPCNLNLFQTIFLSFFLSIQRPENHTDFPNTEQILHISRTLIIWR